MLPGQNSPYLFKRTGRSTQKPFCQEVPWTPRSFSRSSASRRCEARRGCRCPDGIWLGRTLDADKQALVPAYCRCLFRPAPLAESVDDGKDVAMEAMADEMRKFCKPASSSWKAPRSKLRRRPSRRPRCAPTWRFCSGQWPEAQRSVLVSRYTEGARSPVRRAGLSLLRSATFTSGQSSGSHAELWRREPRCREARRCRGQVHFR